MKNKLILIIWGLVLFSLPTIQAQNVFMTIDEQTELQRYIDLGGKASAVFVSSMEDLVIVSNKKKISLHRRKTDKCMNTKRKLILQMAIEPSRLCVRIQH